MRLQNPNTSLLFTFLPSFIIEFKVVGGDGLFRALFPQLMREIIVGIVVVFVCGTAYADPLVRVYAIRGFAGVVFSRGMNKLCDELGGLPQVACTVEDFYSESEIERKASIDADAGQKVILVGHSWGANAALQIAATIPASVPLVVTIDPNWFPEPPPVPNNVEVVLNYYQDFDMLGRAVLIAGPEYRGKLIQIIRHEAHVMIDDDPEIHADVISQIKDILARLGTRAAHTPNMPARRPRRSKIH